MDNKTRRSVSLFVAFFLCCCGQAEHTGSQRNEDTSLQQTRRGLLKNESDASFPQIPIFIITCDRLTDLKVAIASYKKASSTPVEIVIHDNHSTYPPMLDYLDELERDGTLVFRHNTEVSRDAQLDSVAQTIQTYFTTHESPYYVVTDPDIELDPADGSVLQLYAHLLDWHPEVNVVGPMLRVDDLPDHYPLKQQVIASHNNHFASLQSFDMVWNGNTIRVQRGSLDTTFGMYRSSFRFHRLNTSLQLYGPYHARHLDWYLDPENLAEDQIYYIRHASAVSHWGGAWLRDHLPDASR